jgi:Ca-activated chloride channel family protein
MSTTLTRVIPIPPDGQAFGINIDGGPSPFEENQNYQIMRVGIQGYAVSPEERKDVSLTFVIDVSGSMNMDNRLGLVKRSLALLVKQLRPSDRVSIVVFGTNAEVILEPTAGDRSLRITQAINRLQPGGVTNAEAGLMLGYQMADEAFIPGGINRVILCSDGVPTWARRMPAPFGMRSKSMPASRSPSPPSDSACPTITMC